MLLKARIPGLGALLLVVLATTTCTDELIYDPLGAFEVELGTELWPDSAVVGEEIVLRTKLEDEDGNRLVDVPLRYTSSDTAVLWVDTVPAADSVIVRVLRPGAATVTARLEERSFEEREVAVEIETWLAGVGFTEADDTLTTTAIHDTLIVRARGHGTGGEPVDTVGLRWSTADTATLDFLPFADGDSARVVPKSVGLGSILVTHDRCASTACTAELVLRATQVPAAIGIDVAMDTLRALGDTAALTAAAVDSNGYVVPDLTFEWSSSSPTVLSVDADGRIEAIENGSAWIRAGLGGIVDSVAIIVRQAADSIEIVSGDAQGVEAGSTLPQALVVRVRDSNAHAAAGVAVRWRTDVGTLSADTVMTDSLGIAAVRWTLGAERGEVRATAAAAAVEVGFTGFAADKVVDASTGGEVESDDSKVVIDVAPEAVQSETPVYIKTLEEESIQSLDSAYTAVVYEFGPEGTEFAATDTLEDGSAASGTWVTFTYDPAAVPKRPGGDQPATETLKIMKLVDGIWVPQPTIVDTVNHTIRARVSSFSKWAWGAPTWPRWERILWSENSSFTGPPKTIKALGGFHRLQVEQPTCYYDLEYEWNPAFGGWSVVPPPTNWWDAALTLVDIAATLLETGGDYCHDEKAPVPSEAADMVDRPTITNTNSGVSINIAFSKDGEYTYPYHPYRLASPARDRQWTRAGAPSVAAADPIFQVFNAKRSGDEYGDRPLIMAARKGSQSFTGRTDPCGREYCMSDTLVISTIDDFDAWLDGAKLQAGIGDSHNFICFDTFWSSRECVIGTALWKADDYQTTTGSYTVRQAPAASAIVEPGTELGPCTATMHAGGDRNEWTMSQPYYDCWSHETIAVERVILDFDSEKTVEVLPFDANNVPIPGQCGIESASGESVTVRCEPADGSPDLSIRWITDDASIALVEQDGGEPGRAVIKPFGPGITHVRAIVSGEGAVDTTATRVVVLPDTAWITPDSVYLDAFGETPPEFRAKSRNVVGDTVELKASWTHEWSDGAPDNVQIGRPPFHIWELGEVPNSTDRVCGEILDGLYGCRTLDISSGIWVDPLRWESQDQNGPGTVSIDFRDFLEDGGTGDMLLSTLDRVPVTIRQVPTSVELGRTGVDTLALSGDRATYLPVFRDRNGYRLYGRAAFDEVVVASSDTSVAFIENARRSPVMVGDDWEIRYNIVVRARQKGTARVTVHAGADTAVVGVEVATSATAVTIAGSASYIFQALGDSIELSATAYRYDGAVVDEPVEWRTTNDGVVTISDYGIARVVGRGSARIIAAAGHARDTVTVSVAQKPVRIELSAPNVTFDSVGDTLTIHARAYDANGFETPDVVSIDWPDDYFDHMGSLRMLWTWDWDGIRYYRLGALGYGSSWEDLTLSAGDITMQRRLRFSVAANPSDVMIYRGDFDYHDQTPADTLNYLGETALATALVVDKSGQWIGELNASWVSLNPEVASVEVLDGWHTPVRITAGAPGTADLIATYGALADTFTVLVRQVPATIEISGADTMTALGPGVQLTGAVFDGGGAEIPAEPVQWSSADPAIASVSAGGKVTARANGTTRMIATSGPARATAEVVVAQRIASVDVSPDTTLIYGESVQMAAVALDRNGYVVPGARFRWSVDDVMILSIDQNGLATATTDTWRGGRAIVSASTDSITGEPMYYGMTGTAGIGVGIRKVAFVSDSREIQIMDSDGQNREVLVPAESNIGDPSWVSSNKLIFRRASEYVNGDVGYNVDIYAVFLGTGAQMRLTEDSAADHSAEYNWFGGIVFVRDSSRISQAGRWGPAEDIYVMEEDGSNVRRLTSYAGVDYLPTWSSDGRTIAFVSDRYNDGDPYTSDWNIFTMTGNGTNVTRVPNTAGCQEPSWSPDGTRIAMRCYVDGQTEIFVIAPDGSGKTRLTNHPAPDYYPTWSLDGSKIAFGSNRDGDWEIYIMNADGSELTQITENTQSDTYPALR